MNRDEGQYQLSHLYDQFLTPGNLKRSTGNVGSGNTAQVSSVFTRRSHNQTSDE